MKLQILKDLVNIKSKPDVSNLEIVRYIQDYFKEYEQEVIEQKKGDLELYNLIVTIKSKKGNKKPILILMHTDTVKGDWFKSASIEDDKLVGLGSCDMKAGITAIMLASKALNYERDLILGFSCDEETSGKGARLIKKKLKGQDFELIILPEPTTNICYISQNSCIGYEVTTKGLRMHGSLNDAENNEKNNNARY